VVARKQNQQSELCPGRPVGRENGRSGEDHQVGAPIRQAEQPREVVGDCFEIACCVINAASAFAAGDNGRGQV
jgi:hypothetical protein